MRKFGLIVLGLLLASASVFGQEGGSGEGGGPGPRNIAFYEPVDFMLGIRGSYNFWGFSLIPSAELVMGDFSIGEYLPFAWGVSARGLFGFYSGYYSVYYSSYNAAVTFGIGAFATLHMGIRNTPIPPLNHLEWYGGFGIKWDSVEYFEYTPLGFSGYSGFKYWFNDNFGAVVDYSYWGASGTSIGIEFIF